MKTFDELAKWVYDGQHSKACDSSERRHLFEFLADIVSNVDFDIQSGNYAGEDRAEVLRQQLGGSLDALASHVRLLLADLDYGPEIGPEIAVERLPDGRFRVDIDTTDDEDDPNHVPENEHGPQIKICLNDHPIWNNE